MRMNALLTTIAILSLAMTNLAWAQEVIVTCSGPGADNGTGRCLAFGVERAVLWGYPLRVICARQWLPRFVMLAMRRFLMNDRCQSRTMANTRFA